jgi:hypothetical protein
MATWCSWLAMYDDNLHRKRWSAVDHLFSGLLWSTLSHPALLLQLILCCLAGDGGAPGYAAHRLRAQRDHLQRALLLCIVLKSSHLLLPHR